MVSDNDEATPLPDVPISEYTAERKKALNRMANPEMTDEEFDKHWEGVQEMLENMKNPPPVTEGEDDGA